MANDYPVKTANGDTIIAGRNTSNYKERVDSSHGGWLPNAYAHPHPWVTTTSTPSAAVTAGRLYMYAFFLPRRALIDRLACAVTTLGSSSAIKLALYDASPWQPDPVNLLTDLNPTGVATTTTGNKEIVLANPVELPAGVYGAAALPTGTLAQFMSVQAAAANGAMQGGYSSLANINANHNTARYKDVTYADGFPQTISAWGGVIQASTPPVVLPRIAAWY